MSASPKPRLSVGTSDFAKLREAGTLYVDKTDFVRRVADGTEKVLLFPRPRRFGKTTNLSMLRYFLGKSEKDHAPALPGPGRLAVRRWLGGTSSATPSST